jgi:hypothetical protein
MFMSPNDAKIDIQAIFGFDLAILPVSLQRLYLCICFSEVMTSPHPVFCGCRLHPFTLPSFQQRPDLQHTIRPSAVTLTR